MTYYQMMAIWRYRAYNRDTGETLYNGELLASTDNGALKKARKIIGWSNQKGAKNQNAKITTWNRFGTRDALEVDYIESVRTFCDRGASWTKSQQ